MNIIIGVLSQNVEVQHLWSQSRTHDLDITSRTTRMFGQEEYGQGQGIAFIFLQDFGNFALFLELNIYSECAFFWGRTVFLFA